MIHTNRNIHEESYNRWFVGLGARKNKLKKKKKSGFWENSFQTPYHLMQNPETCPKNYWTEQLEKSYSSISFGSTWIISSNCQYFTFGSFPSL